MPVMIRESGTKAGEVSCGACGEIGLAVFYQSADGPELRPIEPPFGWFIRGDQLICRCGHTVSPQ